MGAQSDSAAADARRLASALDGGIITTSDAGLAEDLDRFTKAPVIALDDAHRGRSRLSDHSPLTNAPLWKLGVKRLTDIVGALALLIVLSPVMLAAAAAVRLTSRGPVLFRQDRVGKDGEHFSMLKFRSMRIDAEDRLADVFALNEQTGPVFKAKDDPRITQVGRILRRCSIDEMPQLFHVLSGSMSLVGPRPALPSEVEHYTPYAQQRLLAKPGLTCIWQVNGRSTIDFETWVEMDLDYIEQWSIRSDIKLLAETLPAVLSGDGAY